MNIRQLIFIVTLTLMWGIFVGYIAGVSRASASDDWSTNDKMAECVWLTLHTIDWGQTRNIAMDPEHYYEAGIAKFFVGEHPSVRDVDIYMGLSAILHPIITNFLPKRARFGNIIFNPRAVWQAISIGMSGNYVVNNFNVGLTVRF